MEKGGQCAPPTQVEASQLWPPSRFCQGHQKPGHTPFGGRPILLLAASYVAAARAVGPQPLLLPKRQLQTQAPPRRRRRKS